MAEARLVSAGDKARSAMLTEMPPELQKVALQLDACLAKEVGVSVICRYRMGQHVRKVLLGGEKNESTYGTYAIEHLADYVGMNTTYLYGLKGVAEAFPSEAFVQEWSQKVNNKGDYLGIMHFVAVAQIKSAKERETWLARAHTNSWSSRELALQINASGTPKENTSHGGRLPGRPANPISGLHAFTQLTNKFNRYEDKIANKYIFKPIQEFDVESVTLALQKKLEESSEALTQMEEYLAAAKKSIEACMTRVEKVLKDKESKATEDEAPAPKPKPAAKAAKASSNGKPKPAQAGRKKPQAVAATA